MRWAILAAALILLGAPPVSGQQGEGWTAYKGGDYEAALRLLLPQARSGDAAAQAALGAMHWSGQGTPRSPAEAARWFGMAAEQGHPQSQAILGFMYLEGTGVAADLVQSHKWLNLAVSALPPGELAYKAVRERDIVARRLSPEQLHRARELAREWWAMHPR